MKKTDTSTPKYVVAIGASAGGLDALEHFFENTDSIESTSFVIVQHLSPDYKSMMPQLLSKYTKLEIQTIEDEMPIRSGVIFILPPASVVELNGTNFKLSERILKTNLPIDIFFTSLAKSYGKNSFAVILSGTGSDGTRGAQSINESGGVVFAQSPKEAKFDGMPNSVIRSGVVDKSDTVAELTKTIKELITHGSDSECGLSIFDKSDKSKKNSYEAIFGLLHNKYQVDFASFKEPTVFRRIEKRLQINKIHDLNKYYEYLENNTAELEALYYCILISVTSFFRNPSSFEALKEKAIEPIIKNSQHGETIRVWIAGCSTGEEVYSIIILFLEKLEELGVVRNLKVFASDLNRKCIDLASQGFYPNSIESEVSKERLNKYFESYDNRYQIKPIIRKTVIFSEYNLLTHAPFTRMHLVVCRNTLIYFQKYVQDIVLSKLFYASRNNGYVFLGKSESVSNSYLDFNVIDPKHKIFRSKQSNLLDNTGLKTEHNTCDISTSISRHHNEHLPTEEEIINNLLFNKCLPPTLLINKNNEILHVYGGANRFLKLLDGKISNDIHHLLDQKLAIIISSLVYKSLKNNNEYASEFIELNDEDTIKKIKVIVFPLSSREMALVKLEVYDVTITKEETTQNIDEITSTTIQNLRSELTATQEHLRNTIEALETSNEELQSTNEELMSSNEELQSSNEELQSLNEELNTLNEELNTLNEELNTLNEELNTLNAEYEEKAYNLHTLNADLESMMKGIGNVTIFLDHELSIRRYSDESLSIFDIRRSDIGRPLLELSNRLNISNDELKSILLKCIQSEGMIEKKMKDNNSNELLLKCISLTSSSIEIENGCVLTVIDLSGL
ncbi:PAS domain-containing protein [Francisellaceae bacterium]|nr:PAS domain-containing protein [Francisellaceae bacterium]